MKGDRVGVERRVGRYTKLGRDQDLRDRGAVCRILGGRVLGAGRPILNVRALEFGNVGVHGTVQDRDGDALARDSLIMDGLELVEVVVVLLVGGHRRVGGVSRRNGGKGRSEAECERAGKDPDALTPASCCPGCHDRSSSESSTTAGLPRRCERITRPPSSEAPRTAIADTM